MTRTLIAALAFAALSPLSWAGYVNPTTAYVNLASDGSGMAYGALRNVAYSSDSTSYVHCVVVESSTNSDWAQCAIRDSQSNYAACYSYDATVIDAVRSVKDASLVQLGVTAQGTCAYVRVQNDSAYL